jgi:anti-sigma-K factor RskA
MDLTREQQEELLAGRALDALNSVELRKIETVIAGDAELLRLGAELDDAAATLALLAEPVAPPMALRERILASTRIRTAMPRRVGSARDGSENVVNFPGQPRSQTTEWLKRGLAIAAMLLLVVSAGTIIRQVRRASEAASDLVRSNEKVQDLERQLTHEREIRDLLTNPNTNMIALNGTPEMPAAHAKFMYDRATGKGMLMADQLPAAPAGKAYQLWFIVDGKPMPSKVFKPGENGRGEMEAQVPPEARAKATFAVNMEKESGAQQPEGKMYLVSGS